jgi:ribosomal protein S18 acetylase RimI-like enzyme
VKQLRRLDTTAAKTPYDGAQRGALRDFGFSPEELRALERARPELVVIDEDAVLVGQVRQRRCDLHYAFPDKDGFVRRFPSMFARLLDGVQPSEAPLGFRVRLIERPARPYVEPVLVQQAFELSREWMEMTLVELPDAPLPSGDIAPGFGLRDARPEDAQAIVELEDAAFATPALTIDEVREFLKKAAFYRVVEDTATGSIVGSLLGEARPAATGYVNTLAVHPQCQRRGLGEAMLRWALARFREQGLRRATLTVSTDNAGAIALYRKLGFTPGMMGVNYRRPIDPDEVRQVLEKHRGSIIKFGGWR